MKGITEEKPEIKSVPMTTTEAILLTALIFVILYSAFMIALAAISDRILYKLVEMEEEKRRSVITFNDDIERLLSLED